MPTISTVSRPAADAAPERVVDHVVDRETEEEERLVAAAVAGDDRAFSTLVERHRNPLHAHCRGILRSTADADDAVQEALLRAWRRRAAFEGRSSFGWWLHCIATNTCLDVVGRARRARVAPRPFGPDDASDPDPRLGPGADGDPADRVVEQDAVAAAYLVALRVLPARQRAVLVLRDVLRFSAAETAAVLGDSVPSVNSALQRARSTLDRRRRVPAGRVDRHATPAEREVVRRLIDALRRADTDALVALCGAP